MAILEYDDTYFMQKAYDLALCALEEEEVPVGAVIVCKDKIIASAYNQTEKLNDPTAHAEMQAITCATDAIGGKYLNECTLYVTLEPCVMCAGALYWSQIGRVVYGAKDEKRGASRLQENIYHPKTQITSGIMEEECSKLLKDFFKKKR
jgi:tRNA(adenine34) deaminase